MEKYISVIVPVYNVSKYLSICVDSIISQDYPFLEIILIDDGSTDGSSEICDKYAVKDNRIKVLHQANSGAAAAKNAGLRIATGEFLSFVDSDDFLEPYAYSHMVHILQEENADVVQCSYRDLYKNRTVDHIAKPQSMSQREYLGLFVKDWTCALLWDKLFRAELFKGIFFETGHKIDDEYFTYLGIMNAAKIIRNSNVIYNYRKRASSIMYSPSSYDQIIFDRIDYLNKRRKKICKKYPELKTKFNDHFLNMMIILSRDKNVADNHIIKIRECLKEYYRDNSFFSTDPRLIPSLIRIVLKKHKTNPKTPEKRVLTDDISTFFE